MRFFLMLGLTMLLAACGSEDGFSVGNKTTLEVAKVFDAGDVIKGEMVPAKFTVKNTGSYPLIIADIGVSCSCTVADFNTDPIAPGQSTEILAHVNTERTGTGVVVKELRITANTDPSVTHVSIRANVQKN